MNAGGYKIAVATKDGKVITEHFGRCSRWSVFHVDGDKYRFLEYRDVVSPCVDFEHSDNALNNTVELLSDCRALLALKIGPGALSRLEAAGLTVFEIGADVDLAIKKLIDYFARTRNAYVPYRHDG